MRTPLNRRDFLCTSAAASTACLWGQRTASRAAAVSTANAEIRTAIIGIRNQGQNHIRYHAKLDNVRIVALCDVDKRLFADRLSLFQGAPPKIVSDFRRVLDDKDVDCVVLAIPNHWHALATIWACQAGKDVYVEKPATYCIAEGRKMIAAATKHRRIVQNGTHLRAQVGRQEAVKLLREGVIGDLYMARAIVFNPRKGIGTAQDCAAPADVDYNLWLGPASERPFNPNRFHYNWHWNWDYGNGECGNNGVHMLDIVIEGLNKQDTLPTRIASQGGRYVWNDQGETPNVQSTTYRYGDGMLVSLDIRNLTSNDEAGSHEGVVFYGSKGFLTLSHDGRFQTIVDGKPGPDGSGKGAHVELLQNFYNTVRSRNEEKLLAPLRYGHTAAALCHLANIAYRLGRSVEFDPTTEAFPRDAEANALASRRYRERFTVTEET